MDKIYLLDLPSDICCCIKQRVPSPVTDRSEHVLQYNQHQQNTTQRLGKDTRTRHAPGHYIPKDTLRCSTPANTHTRN